MGKVKKSENPININIINSGNTRVAGGPNALGGQRCGGCRNNPRTQLVKGLKMALNALSGGQQGGCNRGCMSCGNPGFGGQNPFGGGGELALSFRMAGTGLLGGAFA